MSIVEKIKRKIENRIISLQGGQVTSEYLRKITRERYKIDVALYSYGSCFSPDFNIGGEVSIGRYCSFGQDVHYFGGNHPMHYISTSPYFYRKSWGGAEVIRDIDRYKLRIGNDVWIGQNVMITSRCTSIGDGAVIATGSVVTKSVEAYSVVAGNPARLLKYRFSEKEIQKLLNARWYEFTPEELMKFYDYIEQPLKFADKIMEFRSSNGIS